MSNELANLIAKKFIARPDVKAIQMPEGHYIVDEVARTHERRPWNRDALNAHLSGEKTYGHYLLNPDDTCKLFAFDIDLEKNDPSKNFEGTYCLMDDESATVYPCNPRVDWTNRAHPARPWLKYQMKMLASKLAASIERELAIPTAVAYSGAKGLHVYGFTGPVPAADAREGAMIVLDSLGDFEATRGTNFYKHKDSNPVTGFQNLSIEVFPKQDSLDGKDLGNLMRIPLGRNLKSADPTFFVDMTSPMGQLVPVDPVWALNNSPFRSTHD